MNTLNQTDLAAVNGGDDFYDDGGAAGAAQLASLIFQAIALIESFFGGSSGSSEVIE